MTIKVLAFGQINDIISVSEMKLSEISNTEQLGIEMNRQFPELALMKYAVAVNGKIVNNNTVLKDKDTVALLPPFSGG